MSRADRAQWRRDDRGAVAVVVAILATALFVMCALVVDLGLARDTRRQAQNAADASALAGAQALYASGSADLDAAIAAVKSYAAANLGTTEAQWSSCSDAGAYYVKPGSTPCISFADDAGLATAVSPSTVRVVIPQEDVNVGLGQAAGVGRITVGALAEAKAAAPGGGACGLCALDSTAVSGNPSVIANAANIHLNGSPSFSGNPTVSVVGGAFNVASAPSVSGQPTFSPQPTVVGTITDPLAGVPLPLSTVTLPYVGDVSRSGQQSCNLTPGRYGNIRITGQVACVLAPGLYAFTGSFSMSGGSSWDATSGVTMYFTCGTATTTRECGTSHPYVEYGGRLSLTGNNVFRVDAPDSGTTKGLAIVYDRNNAQDLDYSGTNQNLLSGTIYAKSAQFNLSGTADTVAIDSMIVVRHLRVSGNGTIRVTYDASRNVPLTRTYGLSR